MQSLAPTAHRQATRGSNMRHRVRQYSRSWALLPARAIGLTSLTIGALLGLEAAVCYSAEELNTPPIPPTVNDAHEASELDEIVVTARKRTEALMDVPASITAISSGMIEEAHMTQIDDIGSAVSNLNIFEAHDNTPAVTMRGVGAFELVQGVGFYVNDIQLFEGQTIRPNDLERIEVLKGPQGTLYGGANIGGAIKYITKEPSAQWENQATVEFGQYATRDYQAVVSGPLVAGGGLGLRASFYDDNHGGYLYDTFRKFNFGDTSDHGGRITLAFAPAEATTIHVYLSADDLKTGNENLNYTPPDANTYSYSVNDYYIPYFRRRLWSGALKLDHQFGAEVAFTSLTSYFASYTRSGTDLAKQPLPIDLLVQIQDRRVYSQEFRLASAGTANLDWLVGMFFQSLKTQTATIDNFGTGDVNNPAFVGTDLDQNYKLQKTYALFADATYHYHDWSFEAGVRGEYYTSYESAYNNSVAPIASGAEHLHGNEVTPRATVQYKFGPELNVYATAARG